MPISRPRAMSRGIKEVGLGPKARKPTLARDLGLQEGHYATIPHRCYRLSRALPRCRSGRGRTDPFALVFAAFLQGAPPAEFDLAPYPERLGRRGDRRLPHPDRSVAAQPMT